MKRLLAATLMLVSSATLVAQTASAETQLAMIQTFGVRPSPALVHAFDAVLNGLELKCQQARTSPIGNHLAEIAVKSVNMLANGG
jgi:hypothetical protein